MADILGAGVAKALLGKAAVPDELPFVTGSIGLLGTEAELGNDERVRHAAHGRLGFPYREFLPKEGRRAACRSTSTAACSSLRYPMEVNLVGDSRETLRALMPLLQRKDRPALARADREETLRDWWERARSARDGRGAIRSIRSACSGSCRRGCRTTASSPATPGSAANWYARDLKIRRGMMASLSGKLATMGPAVPYAIAAKFAYPGPRGDRAGRATARCR